LISLDIKSYLVFEQRAASKQFDEADQLEATIRKNLEFLGYGK
jgi:hypothetical protein